MKVRIGQGTSNEEREELTTLDLEADDQLDFRSPVSFVPLVEGDHSSKAALRAFCLRDAILISQATKRNFHNPKKTKAANGKTKAVGFLALPNYHTNRSFLCLPL
jgi:hypothetical protein